MSKKEDDFIKECIKKYKLAIDNENENRMRWVEDMKFAHVPGYQWPSELRSLRENPASPRPCIEINITAQHVYQVTNDIRQNMPTVKCRPVAMNASTDVAEVYDGIIRHIHSCSKANIAINTAMNHAVTAGWGYIRILTEYVNKAENEQEIRIKPVDNPLSCVFDAASMCHVGSDALCAWVADDMSRSKFESTFGKKIAKEAGQWQGDTSESDTDWVTKDTVRVCEYFERLEREVLVYEMMDGSEISEAEYTKRLELDPIVAQQVFKTETETEFYVKWTKLTSFKILEEREFPSQYIPLIRVPGLVVDIEGIRYYKGLVRDAKDSQRVLNYQWSNVIETGALQPKVPYVGAAGQFDGYEAEWGMANTANLPYLEYNSKDANDIPQGAPQRQQLQMVSQGLMAGVQMAKDAIKEVTGQYNASLGQQSNETSGKAIIARQREGDTATYHFIDGLQMAIEHLGRIEIDMTPRIYDTKRVMRILGEDNSTEEVRIDPGQPEAVRETQINAEGEVAKIYNLTVGRYDVIATVGPSFTTKRAEAVEAMTQIMQGNPQVFPLIGDIWVRNQDWPGSDEISDRMKTLLPPEIQQQEKTGMQIPPQIAQQMQQMQQQMQQMQQALQQTQQALQQAQAGNEAKIQSSQIQAQQRMQEAQLQAQTDIAVAQIQMEAKAQIAQMEAQIKAQAEIMKPHPPQVYESIKIPQ